MTELAKILKQLYKYAPHIQEYRREHEHNEERKQDRNKIPFNSFLCHLQLKNPPHEIKNSLNRLHSRLDTAENKNSELEDIEIQTFQISVRAKKDLGKKPTEPQTCN